MNYFLLSRQDPLDILFRRITTFIKVHVAFVFGFQSGPHKQRPHKFLWTHLTHCALQQGRVKFLNWFHFHDIVFIQIIICFYRMILRKYCGSTVLWFFLVCLSLCVHSDVLGKTIFFSFILIYCIRIWICEMIFLW